jgi:hypothetical protein
MLDPRFFITSGSDTVAGACRRLATFPQIGYNVFLGQAYMAVTHGWQVPMLARFADRKGN